MLLIRGDAPPCQRLIHVRKISLLAFLGGVEITKANDTLISLGAK